MNDFVRRIKDMCKTEEEFDKPKEKMYGSSEVCIVEDLLTGDIFICAKESLNSDKGFTIKLAANNIENGNRVLEYRLNTLPGGRACFGGFTDMEYNNHKRLYSFSDVFYKIYGKGIPPYKKFTREELLYLTQEFNDKFKDAKFISLYSLAYKNSVSKNGFNGTKYFGVSLEEGSEDKIFEMIDDDNISIKKDNNNLIITVGNKRHIQDCNLDFLEAQSENSLFEIKLVDSIGISRVYSKAKFTKEACRQIIKNYEKERGTEI